MQEIHDKQLPKYNFNIQTNFFYAFLEWLYMSRIALKQSIANVSDNVPQKISGKSFRASESQPPGPFFSSDSLVLGKK